MVSADAASIFAKKALLRMVGCRANCEQCWLWQLGGIGHNECDSDRACLLEHRLHSKHTAD
jgi:hypothetical protein